MVELESSTDGGSETFAALFEESLKREDVKEGDIVRGRVIQVAKDYVVVDIGYKSEGRVPLEKERAELKEQTLDKLKEGQLVDGIVKNLTEYGAFIDLGGIDGLLHITDMSWGRVNHPSELFQVGDHVRVKVLKFNADTERVSLGLKQISEDPWTMAEQIYKPGTVVKGKVVSLKDYGAFIELQEGIEGLVHISEMSEARGEDQREELKAGQEVEAAVVIVVAAERKSGPSMMSANRQQEIDAAHDRQ